MDQLTPVEKKMDSQKESTDSAHPKKSFKKVLEETKEKRQNQDEPQDHDEKPSPFSIGLFIPSPQSADEVVELTDIRQFVPIQIEELTSTLEVHMITLVENGDDTHLSTTYVKENSIFNGLEINLDHFSTAPHSFNLNLYGSPEAAELLTENLPLLMAKLEKKLPQMQFHCLPPFIKDDRKVSRPIKSQKAKNIVTQVRSSF